MPIPEEAAEMDVTSETGPAAGQLSRRSVLRSAAGVGAAGLAVTALAGTPALAASRLARPTAPAQHRADEPAAEEAVVVHVRDLRTGQMDVYRGTSRVRVHNRELAAQLTRASR